MESSSSSVAVEQIERSSADDQVPRELLAALEHVDHEARSWYRELSVSMGQAQKLTDLKDSQIRYFEELDALHPQKTSRQSGASRLYTVVDLRRLRVLSLLSKQGMRAAEAADLLKRYERVVDQGVHPSVAEVLTQEQRAVADGFVLARIISQLMGAVQVELAPSERKPLEEPPLRVRGALFPRKPLFSSQTPDALDVKQAVDALLQNPTGVLLARVQVSDTAGFEHFPLHWFHADQNSQTVLFFSDEARDPGWELRYQYCVYIPPQQPQRTMVVLVEADADAQVPLLLEPQHPARCTLLELFLEIAEPIWTGFCHYTLAKNYRYRSDGFPLDQTRRTYTHLLTMIRTAMFPNDTTAMAVLLIPDSLEHPTSLMIMAHAGYVEDLVLRARLDLRGKEPQGLSGRAYRLREPFLTLNAQDNPYIEYAFAEGCTQALAIPLATSWGIAPFGVLYLATRSPEGGLTSNSVYAAMVLGSALSELLGRWWLTRLRHDLDMQLHRHINHLVRWIDSLDMQSPDFRRGITAIADLWDEIDRNKNDPAFLRTKLMLAVLDIDQYRETVQASSNELLPIAAQRHVREVIEGIDPTLDSYWFNNDHALLILRSDQVGQPLPIVERIQEQVSATPISAFRRDGSAASITVSVAYKTLSFQALYDLGKRDPGHLDCKVQAIVENLCQETQRRAEARRSA
jgi:DNA-binding transcriptional MerR regulator